STTEIASNPTPPAPAFRTSLASRSRAKRPFCWASTRAAPIVYARCPCSSAVRVPAKTVPSSAIVTRSSAKFTRASVAAGAACDTMNTSRSISTSAGVLVDRGAPVGPGARALERRGGAQDAHVVEATPHDLQPDRQPVLGEAARHRRSGLTGQVERERERDPGVRLDSLAGDLGRVVEPDREGRARDRRRQ